jgi:hypothetical protein
VRAAALRLGGVGATNLAVVPAKEREEVAVAVKRGEFAVPKSVAVTPARETSRGTRPPLHPRCVPEARE